MVVALVIVCVVEGLSFSATLGRSVTQHGIVISSHARESFVDYPIVVI